MFVRELSCRYVIEFLVHLTGVCLTYPIFVVTAIIVHMVCVCDYLVCVPLER